MGKLELKVIPLISNNDSSQSQFDSMQNYLDKINENQNFCLKFCNVDEVKKSKYCIVFVGGGGTESEFLKVYKKLPSNIYLLTTKVNNSLAASMEILSFLYDKKINSEILHGSIEQIAKRISQIGNNFNTLNLLSKTCIARIGRPSDWLIASDVNADKLLRKFGVRVIDIDMDEFIAEINKNAYEEDDWTTEFKKLKFNDEEMQKALSVYGAILRLKEKYQFNALTVRCFDLLTTVKTTSCIALSLLNAQGIHSACEGDVPSLMSMIIAKTLTQKPVFQSNPSIIDKDNNQVLLAHCTLPFDMSSSKELMTHFESGIGVALRGKIQEGEATVFKCSGLLDRYFCSSAKITQNLEDMDSCRTQIMVKLDRSVEYFFRQPIGNHHIVINGDYAGDIDSFFSDCLQIKSL